MIPNFLGYNNGSYNYQIIKLVAQNLKYIKQLCYYMKDIYIVSTNIDIIKNYTDNINSNKQLEFYKVRINELENKIQLLEKRNE